MKYLKALPIVLVVVHALLVVLTFGLAIRDPIRGGLWPLVVYATDLPASWLLIRIGDSFGHDHSLTYQFLAGATTFLLLGSFWWYYIGRLIAFIITKLVGRKFEKPVLASDLH